jgi:hypothetical protein
LRAGVQSPFCFNNTRIPSSTVRQRCDQDEAKQCWNWLRVTRDSAQSAQHQMANSHLDDLVMVLLISTLLSTKERRYQHRFCPLLRPFPVYPLGLTQQMTLRPEAMKKSTATVCAWKACLEEGRGARPRHSGMDPRSLSGGGGGVAYPGRRVGSRNLQLVRKIAGGILDLDVLYTLDMVPEAA